jgi:hypothetical protein
MLLLLPGFALHTAAGSHAQKGNMFAACERTHPDLNMVQLKQQVTSVFFKQVYFFNKYIYCF